MLIPRNEGKACDAVIRRFEALTGETRSHVRCPERDGVGPPVDLRVKMGSEEYAVEHTLLQPYRNRIQYGARFNTINKFIRERITDPLPGSVYYKLNVPIDVSLPRKRKHRDKALLNLVEWILTTAQRLHERRRLIPWPSPWPPYIAVNNTIEGVPDGFECSFELLRWPDEVPAQPHREPGSLGIDFQTPKEFENPLASALSESFEKKFPKLHACKAQGARTLLVLEAIDLPIWNHQFIGNCLPELLSERPDAPDEIYLVEPHRETDWSVWPIKRDDEHWPTVGMPESNAHYFPLGQRPAEDYDEWYRHMNWPFKMFPRISLEWSPAFFKPEELHDLTRISPTDTP